MEKLKAKHDHKLTDVLKVLIFALFLLMPFLTFMPTALYYGFNEHAVNETSTQVDIQYKYQTNEVNTRENLIVGNYYYINYFYVSDEYTGLINIDNYSNEYIDFYRNNTLPTIETIKGNGISYKTNLNAGTISPYTFNNVGARISDEVGSNRFYYNTDNIYQLSTTEFKNYNFGNNYGSSSNIKILKFNFIFKYTEDLIISNNAINYINAVPTEMNDIENVDIQENVEQTISQQMYNSWQTMWQSPFYTWTNQSVLKTGLDNFTAVFGVSNNSYITNLLTYELIIVVIYIVLDIVLTLFTWLTHLFNNKE